MQFKYAIKGIQTLAAQCTKRPKLPFNKPSKLIVLLQVTIDFLQKSLMNDYETADERR